MNNYGTIELLLMLLAATLLLAGIVYGGYKFLIYLLKNKK
jgi:hypothetical protein